MTLTILIIICVAWIFDHRQQVRTRRIVEEDRRFWMERGMTRITRFDIEKVNNN